ncbi:thiosulfate oxidation carrier complex protein SoxZ [Methylobrevis albus]|uniref:Thiosulfate oxidation carrier complex protein SoxZ n=1 Tax=Methylobrevis albus TaxID=2793297 RepID=A0A931I271_9HYPH|nr:thiosulfate oxidation carrier complex protein SoxZ [Methylobrevis albus]MBH0237561.1 thiosulfate oxidation carrier complex protein SoxZ [Methylobrevis albus]
MSGEPRVKLPATARPGDVVRIRTLLGHRMESGFRRGDDGARVPRDIVNRFECRFEGELVFACDLAPAMAANPFLEFSARVERAGRFSFLWIDDAGVRTTATADIALADTGADAPAP